VETELAISAAAPPGEEVMKHQRYHVMVDQTQGSSALEQVSMDVDTMEPRTSSLSMDLVSMAACMDQTPVSMNPMDQGPVNRDGVDETPVGMDLMDQAAVSMDPMMTFNSIPVLDSTQVGHDCFVAN
jgi:hypothetical protein